MKAVKFNGQTFKSLSQCCRSYGVSYSRVVRLCRLYTKAAADPSVAVAWAVGALDFNASREPRTVAGVKERILSTERQRVFRARQRRQRKKDLI